ncbi:MAG: ABC transporter permease subunit [Candidatus Gracilibacteria bacterium]|nr:ABC transporter permease subunit [Candidatus Gracilibacteria bacterium]
MFNIALNTFRELARNKILYMIVFFGVALIGFSLVLATLSLGQSDKIVVDFGLAMVEVFGIISVIFIGSQLLFREIEGKTVYLILSKPVARGDFILGKFLGFATILFFIIFIQSIISTVVFVVAKTPLSFLLFASIGFIYLKLLLLFAIILFFSTFISPLLSILLVMGVYIISHSVTTMTDMAIRSGNRMLFYFSKILMVIFPNFEALNIKSIIGTPVVLHPSFFAINILHALLYLAVMLTFAVLIFNRKTFEN